MGHSHSSPTSPSRMSNLPWQEGYYKCTNMFMGQGADLILVKGNTVDMLGFYIGGLITPNWVTPKLAAGEFGKMT